MRAYAAGLLVLAVAAAASGSGLSAAWTSASPSSSGLLTTALTRAAYSSGVTSAGATAGTTGASWTLTVSGLTALDSELYVTLTNTSSVAAVVSGAMVANAWSGTTTPTHALDSCGAPGPSGCSSATALLAAQPVSATPVPFLLGTLAPGASRYLRLRVAAALGGSVGEVLTSSTTWAVSGLNRTAG